MKDKQETRKCDTASKNSNVRLESLSHVSENISLIVLGMRMNWIWGSDYYLYVMEKS